MKKLLFFFKCQSDTLCFLMPFSSNYRILKDFPQTGFQTTRRTRPSSSRAAEEQRHLSEGPSLGDCFTVVCLLLQICNYSVSNRRLRGRVCVCVCVVLCPTSSFSRRFPPFQVHSLERRSGAAAYRCSVRPFARREAALLLFPGPDLRPVILV